jgi:uncharacterized protein (DUF1697 family)
VPTYVALLRGVNLAGRNRVAMADLRDRLTAAGLADVRTYLQSGNVVLHSDATADAVARECERQLADAFALNVRAVVRTHGELADVVARNPLGDVAVTPKRYLVSFLDAEPPPELVRRLQALAAGGERVVGLGRELYAWHPPSPGRSRLWATMAGRGLGVLATARNWTTVTALHELTSKGS